MLVLLPALKLSHRRVEQGSKPGVGTHTLRREGFYVTHIARCFHVNCINRTVKLKLPGYWTQILASRSCVLVSLNKTAARKAASQGEASSEQKVGGVSKPAPFPITGEASPSPRRGSGSGLRKCRWSRSGREECCASPCPGRGRPRVWPGPTGARCPRGCATRYRASRLEPGTSQRLARVLGRRAGGPSPPHPLPPSSHQVPFSKAMLPRTTRCSSRRCRI